MPAEPSPTPNFFVRLFVMGLPLGILIMAALSFVLFFNKRNAGLEPKSSKYSDLMRQEISAEDLQRYSRILSKDIGERTLTQKENLETAASFVESTMGFDNMGYQVQRRELLEEGNTVTDLVADLPGTSDPKSVLLVVASYAGGKGDTASAPAALMCLAHQFTGSKHKRTLRFVAQGSLVNRPPRFPEFVSIHTENVKEFETAHHGVIILEGAKPQPADSTLGPASDPKSLKLTLWEVDVAASPEKAAQHLQDIAAAIQRKLDE